MNIRLLVCGVAAIAISACSSPETDTSDPQSLEAFASLYGGVFKTPASDVENIIVDRRERVNADALDGVWFYTQMNTGPKLKLYRQRLVNFKTSTDGTIIQYVYGLNAPDQFENAWENAGQLNSLTQADFDPYFTKGCNPVWAYNDNVWEGYVDPKTCVFQSKRRNQPIHIESESRLSKGIYMTTERGFNADGEFLWGSKPGEFITLYPLSD